VGEGVRGRPIEEPSWLPNWRRTRGESSSGPRIKDDVLELRWLPSTASMSDGGFMATLCLFAWEAERA